MHGQFISDHGDDGDKQSSWAWVSKSDLKPTTEALIFAAQEQAFRTNYIKFHIDKTVGSPLCRMCGQKGETITYVVSECSKLDQGKYKGRHDICSQKHPLGIV